MRPFLRSLACLTFALLAACDGGGSGRFDVIVVGDEKAALSPEPPFSPAADLLREATASGLVGLDAEGRVRPDLADRWIVTDDGLSYIFRFENAAMPGSEPLTAREVRAALREAIEALDGTGLGLDLTVIDGIYARTNQVIEIRLKTAMPEFLQLLADPALALRLEARQDRVLDLKADGSALTLSTYAENPRDAETMDLRIAGPKEAVQRFQRGEARLLLAGGIDALPHVEKGGLLRGAIRLDPVTGLFGLAIADREGFLSRPSNREAISMAVDRQALIAPFGIGGWSPRTRLVPEGPLGTQQPAGRWAALTMEERQNLAAQRVAGWVASEGAVAPLSIALPTGTGGDILFRRLSADLSRIGLGARRVKLDEDADLTLVDEVAWMDRPEWYLHRLDCKVTKGLCSQEADALVAQAIAEPDPATRQQLLAEATAALTDLDSFISFGPPIRFSLVRGGVDGFAVNRWGFHPLSQLFADPT